MIETIELASLPPKRQAQTERQTELAARSQHIESTQLASLPPANGKLGKLASSFSLPVCHTRKGGKRQASPANCRTGSVNTLRFVLSLLDDREALKRSREAGE